MIQAEDLQSHFQTPDGTLVDFTETFYNGDTLDLQWTGWDSYWTDQTIGTATANLYVASWNFNVSDYSRILAASIDVSVTGGYSWKININPDVLAINPEYGLYFVNTDTVFGDAPTLQSRGFHILEKSTTSSAVPSATSSKAVSTSTGPTSTPTNTASSGTSSNSEVLNRKQAAGLGVGVGVACTAIFVGLAYMFLRRRRRKSSVPETLENSMAFHPMPNQSEAAEISSGGYENRPDSYVSYQGPKSEPHEMPAEVAPMPPIELSSQHYAR
ncbi:hypothetical protein MYU51_016931 [Penicillium brevicompactum]|uniref:uncharacterized protein n=1 Tax=Penicillium brevicompactum TaxID=5074 RepID=UPI002541C386|nr:uncharacterized protein N7506_001703 [Penicillium brevicompactum]KAJ5348450.1 hypothetical protein N7506_001703 [Penicillium brevicompactum]